MRSFRELQEHMCRSVASLSSNASREEISQVLDPILESFQQMNGELTPVGSSGATPLIVACDKAQAICIDWILQHLKDRPSSLSLLGSPFGHGEFGNTAAHFAANANCIPALRLLCEMMGHIETTPNPAWKLATQRNENYDTPVMIATVGGRDAFLREMRTLLHEESATTSSDSDKVFELVNDDGNTALSLACGHGQVKVVKFLLQEVRVNVTYHHLKEAEQTLLQIDATLSSLPALSAQHSDRRDDVQRCLMMLKESLAEAAQTNMEALLAEEEMHKTRNQGKGGAKKKKAKKSRKSKVGVQADENVKSDNALAPRLQATTEHDCDDKTYANSVDKTTSSSAVSMDEPSNYREVVGEEDLTHGIADKPVAPNSTTGKPSEQVCTDISTGSKLGSTLDVESIIEALSLDPSMLLLSSTDMASNLSPCQLDAVAAVLRNQIQAVKEARTIQARLRDQETQA